MTWLHRFAERVTRQQLRRAIRRRDASEAELRRLRALLRAERQAVESLHALAARWQQIAHDQLAQGRQQGDTK